MKLLSVKIEGFRNIKENKIVFGDGMTSLVSENSYGKSNLIEAIYFAVNFIWAPPGGKSSMMSWEPGIPLNRETDQHDFKADFFFETEFMGEPHEVNYGFSFVWIKNDGGRKINGEWLNIRKTANAKKYEKLISRGGRALFKSSQTGRCSSVIMIADNELVLNKLLNFDGLFYMPIYEELYGIDMHVERHFDALPFFKGNPLVRKDDDGSMLSDFNDIPRTVYQLKKQNRDKYELLVNAYMQLFPNITDIAVKEYDISKNSGIKITGNAPYTVSDKVYSIFVQDKNLNQPINFTSLSDGAQRIFLMLTFAVVASVEKTTLIAFEEPENSIHPSLLQGFLRVAAQLSGGCRIIVASHSPYIIEYVPTSDIYIGMPNPNGIAEFLRIGEKKARRLERGALNDGVSVGSYIFELLSGGEDEIDILSTYLEKERHGEEE